jgi:2-polyprenyl-6-hydroxyphenyl methylase/3-demethylubiquinone-9 3-methyltransferase
MDFTLVSCDSCRHVRVDPRIANERLDELYDVAYYRGEGFDATIDYDAPPSQRTRDENEDIVASVGDAIGESIRGLRWLDVGCGSGTLLEAARERGAIVTGSDSSDAARHCCERKGLRFLDSDTLRNGDERFDVVSAVEVIEHVPDPFGFVRFLRAHVRDGGVVFVRTGNWNVVRYLPGTPYIMPEGHIQYFTPTTMRALFARAGLEEVHAFNRTWFVWRLVPRSVREALPVPLFGALARATNRIAPGLGAFPIGRSPASSP